jgi:putative phosphoribosyl transferase
VAAPVAHALGAPLDVLLVRKLGLPSQPELAMGAIASIEGQVEVVGNGTVLRRLKVPDAIFAQVLAKERAVLDERDAQYRQGRAPAPVRDHVVIVADDGLATGSTMRAALAALRQRSPARLVVAVPVGAPSTAEALEAEADEVVCPLRPEPFLAVGQAYADFAPTTDDEVRAALEST